MRCNAGKAQQGLRAWRPRAKLGYAPRMIFDMIKRMSTKQKLAYKLGVNVMFEAGNQYYHRHYEQ